MRQVKEKDGDDIIKRPLDALLRAILHRRDALQTESLRNGLNQRGRHTSLYSFSEDDNFLKSVEVHVSAQLGLQRGGGR